MRQDKLAFVELIFQIREIENFQAHPNAPMTLHVETDKYVKAAKLVLESGGQRLPLDKSPVRIVALN